MLVPAKGPRMLGGGDSDDHYNRDESNGHLGVRWTPQHHQCWLVCTGALQTVLGSGGSRHGLVTLPPSHQLAAEEIRFNRNFQDVLIQSTPFAEEKIRKAQKESSMC